jgi:hypothetical protein
VSAVVAAVTIRRADTDRRNAAVGDAVDVAHRLGQGAIIDRRDGRTQDERAEDVGAVDKRVGEDRDAGEDFDSSPHQWGLLLGE